ncbi:MAG: DNA polymerase IV [Cyanobacteria bacterium P01_F01_bin.150]
MHRKILHIDMDAFFASIEQRDNPNYRGKPIVVGGRPEQRGAVAAASYEARRYGIHSAMPARTAIQRCPHLIFAPPRFEVYREVSQQIRGIFTDYTDLVEPLSLDEAYLDVTTNHFAIPSAMAVARQIKQQIYDTTHLTASAGVSINKFLAKIASALDKPNGLTLIAPNQANSFLDTLPIEKFYGVGPATTAKMKALGIHCGADLKGWSEEDLVARFGKVGRHYYRVVRTQDNRPVNPNRERKSFGAERSFAHDLDSERDRTQLHQELALIAQKLVERLQQRSGYTLTLKIKYDNYEQITRSRTFPEPLKSVDNILGIAQSLLNQSLVSNRKVRLLGLTVSNLVKPNTTYVQLSLAI